MENIFHLKYKCHDKKRIGMIWKFFINKSQY